MLCFRLLATYGHEEDGLLRMEYNLLYAAAHLGEGPHRLLPRELMHDDGAVRVLVVEDASEVVAARMPRHILDHLVVRELDAVTRLVERIVLGTRVEVPVDGWRARR